MPIIITCANFYHSNVFMRVHSVHNTKSTYMRTIINQIVIQCTTFYFWQPNHDMSYEAELADVSGKVILLYWIFTYCCCLFMFPHWNWMHMPIIITCANILSRQCFYACTQRAQYTKSTYMHTIINQTMQYVLFLTA